MKTLGQAVLAARIEYHWWRISHLKRKQQKKQNEKLFYCENLHRFHANRLETIYEISLGLRDVNGNIVA